MTRGKEDKRTDKKTSRKKELFINHVVKYQTCRYAMFQEDLYVTSRMEERETQ